MIQKTKYTSLFTPFNIGKLQIKNRICYAPVGTGLSENATSAFDCADVEFYVARAKGGAGLITTGAIFTDLEVDKYSPGALGTWQITHNPALFRLTANKLLDRVHSFGTKMFAQLSLGTGRNSGSYAPSEIPTFADPSKNCPALTTEQLQKKLNTSSRVRSLRKIPASTALRSTLCILGTCWTSWRWRYQITGLTNTAAHLRTACVPARKSQRASRRLAARISRYLCVLE